MNTTNGAALPELRRFNAVGAVCSNARRTDHLLSFTCSPCGLMVSEAASDVWHMLTTFLSGAEETFTLDDAKF
jgi:hypothetical protein